MAKSDKELVRIARLRYDRLKKANVKNDTMGLLENQLDIFYKGKKRTSKSGISITNKMSAKDRKVMRQILRGFVNNPESKISSIINTFNKIYQQYVKNISPKNRQKLNNKELSVQEMQELTTKYKRIVNDKELIEHYGSQVVHELVEHSKSNDINFDLYKNVLREGMDESSNNYIDIDNKDTYDVFTDILNKVGDLIESEI